MYRNWETLIKPKTMEIEEETLSPTYGRFHVEPLERGFGITIGNSLRRILLSSLQGAAIYAVRMKGVLHEFSTIYGVREDVTDIILNIKELLVKLHSDGPETLHLKANKPGVVRARDIQTGSNVEI
jgi:DNA-directed RNA polymerase subunit alpha